MLVLFQCRYKYSEVLTYYSYQTQVILTTNVKLSSPLHEKLFKQLTNYSTLILYPRSDLF